MEELKKLQWVDLFQDYDVGFQKLLQVLAPEGQIELLRRKIEEYTNMLRELEQKKSKATNTRTIKRLANKIFRVGAQRQQVKTQAESLQEKIVPIKDAQEVFGLDNKWYPRKYTQNEYKDFGDVIVDHATKLMWQKSGSEKSLVYEKIQEYITLLNSQLFGGYDDWRLPTIPELMSLLEQKKLSDDLNIHPIFDSTQRYCWSVNLLPKEKLWWESAWVILFKNGFVHWDNVRGDYYIRCVRCL
jgi:hypothetical protein